MAPPTSPEALLHDAFEGNGYVRTPDPQRRAEEGTQTYKKGYEVRIVVDDEERLEEVRGALEAVGFRPGSPFPKSGKIAQPVYGREAAEWFQGEL